MEFSKIFAPAFFTPVLRHVLQFVAGALVMKGYIDEGTSEAVVGIGMGAFTVLWFFLTKPSANAEKVAEAVTLGKDVTIEAQPKEVVKGD